MEFLMENPSFRPWEEGGVANLHPLLNGWTYYKNYYYLTCREQYSHDFYFFGIMIEVTMVER